MSHLRLVSEESSEKGLLLFALTTPADVSISAKVDERTRIVERILPAELLDALRRLNRKAEALAAKHLCRLPRTGLSFVMPPIGVNKEAVERRLAALDGEYAALRDRIQWRLPELQREAEAFVLQHGGEQRRRLDAAWVEERFALRWQWIPWLLPSGLLTQLFSQDEQSRIQASFAAEVREAKEAKVEALLATMEKRAAAGEKSVAAGRVLNRRTLTALDEAVSGLEALGWHGARALRSALDALVALRDEYDQAAERSLVNARLAAALGALKARIREGDATSNARKAA